MMQCPSCFWPSLTKIGHHPDTGKQRYKCDKCGKTTSNPVTKSEEKYPCRPLSGEPSYYHSEYTAYVRIFWFETKAGKKTNSSYDYQTFVQNRRKYKWVKIGKACAKCGQMVHKDEAGLKEVQAWRNYNFYR